MTLIEDGFLSGKRDWHRGRKQDKWSNEKRNKVLVFKGKCHNCLEKRDNKRVLNEVEQDMRNYFIDCHRILSIL